MIYLFLTWLLYPFLALRARRRLPPQPRRIALIQTAKIGDFVCTTPLFREIKRHFPDCRLFIIGHGMNEPLARHNPAIDEFLALPSYGLHGYRGRRWLATELRRHAIDTSICVSPSLPAFLAPLWAGVGRRLGILPNFSGTTYHVARHLLTHSEQHRAGRLLLDTEWALLRQIGLHPIETYKEAWPAPGLDAKLDSLLKEHQAPLIGLGISSGNPLKAFSSDQLGRIARGLLALGPLDLVLVGSSADLAIATELFAELPAERCIDAVGVFDLAELPALLTRFQAYVGVDSGITYLAEASGVAVVDVMGPADADDQRPTSERAIVLRTELPCAPCSHAFRTPYSCALGTRACIEQFDIDRFLLQIKALVFQ